MENKEYDIYKAAVQLVNTQSPASSESTREKLVKTLIQIAKEENEPIERAWIIKSYWEKRGWTA